MKIGKIKIKSKGNFIVSVAFFVIMSSIFAMKVPMTDLPDKSEIQYSTGVFSIVTLARFVNHVKLNKVDGSNDTIIFSCKYNAFGNGRESSCGDTKFLVPYVDKKVTIGWYEQEEFLGFKNNLPQLVSIEMDGKMMRSYEEVVKTSKGLQIINIFLYIGSFLFSIWLYKSSVRDFEDHTKKMKNS